MRLSLITLTLALLLLLTHLLLFRFLPGSRVIELPFLERFHLPPLFVADPPRQLVSPEQSSRIATSTGITPGDGFAGPKEQPYVKGPSANPPNY